jgi:hypothetical protein
MTARQIIGFLSILAWGLSPIPGQTHASSADDSSAQCKSLQSADFSRTPDALTQVIEAKLVSASDNAVEYCEVRGYVAPNMGFLLRLPSINWNGKFMELGCAGTCGTTDYHSERVPFNCDDPLRRGYACIVSDGGNKSSGHDMKWAYNDPKAVTDYWFRANHVTALAGKTVAERYYSRTPTRSYFMGCSAGGVQAMFEAERFPWDFDGIVAGGPAVNLTGIWMNFLWANRALTGKNGEALLGQADLEVLHQAVLAKCDLNDGVKDGVIGDPRKCHFDPSALRCTADRTTQCLTDQQIEAVDKIYGGPRTSKGEQIVMPTAQRGSEQTWLAWFGGSASHPTPFYDRVGDEFRYYVFQPNPGPTWELQAFDFDRDYKRLGMAEVSEPANSPDLRRFKARGGKLLSFTGWNDAVEGVLRTVDYYETAERILGGRASTQDFFRLFVIPGMEHCSGGDGPFAVDYLSYLEAWVEKGKAPEKLVGSHVKLEDLKLDNPNDLDERARRREFPLDPGTVVFSRPIYPYPIGTKYLGRGNPQDAASFGPETP